MRLLTTLIALTLTLGGCHLIFPFNASTAPADDASALEQGPVTDAAADAAVDRGPSPDSPALDLHLDSPQPDACVPGSGPSCPCVDNAGKSLVSCVGGPPADDSDCDGLRSGGGIVQDFWPQTHNAMLLADSFSTDPANRWQGTGPSWQWKPLGFTLKPGSAIELKPGCASAFKDSYYLLEAAFKVTPASASWSISVAVNHLSGSQHWRCYLSRQSSETRLKGEVKHITHNGSFDGHYALNVTSTFDIVFQVWRNPSSSIDQYSCRLLVPGLNAELDTIFGGVTKLPWVPGTVSIAVSGAEAQIKHARVFDL